MTEGTIAEGMGHLSLPVPFMDKHISDIGSVLEATEPFL